jgi:Na+:H+ antiporter, NhaA family
LLARRLRIGTLPDGVETRHLIGGAALAGIGFTVALFIADRTFAGTDRLAIAKIAVLVASIAAVTVGALVLTHHRVRDSRGGVR